MTTKAYQIRLLQKTDSPGFFHEMYQRSKPTWASVKRGLLKAVREIEHQMLAPYDQQRDYGVMAGRRAWLQDLAKHCPTDGRELDEHKGLRVREIEVV